MTSIEPTKSAKPRRLIRSLGLAGVAAMALGLMSASPALADGWHHGRGHGHDGWRGPHPVYYAHPRPRVYYVPPPVYYAPRPRVYYYAPPPPVYYAPPPVYYAPPGISLVIPLHIR